MQRPRSLFLTLGFMAFAGWILFILACAGWPAWSPDGKQLAFPYYDQKADAAGIALYDRKAKTVTDIYLAQTSDLLATAQWSQDGKQILLYQIFGDENRFGMEVLGIPAKAKFPIRSLAITSTAMGDWPPLAEVNGTLYLGLNGLTTLDLTTWESRQESVGRNEFAPFAMGERVMYLTSPKQEESESTSTEKSPPAGGQVEKEKKESPVPLEFGELDQKNLSRHAWFTITDQQLAEFTQCKGADLLRPPAVDPGTGRIAFAVKCKEQSDAILLLDRGGMRRVVRPRVEGTFRLSNSQWSPDRKTLYAGLYIPAEKEQGRYSLAEIAFDTETVRLTPITRLGFSGDDYHNEIQLSLSPDGSMIATSTALIKSDSDVDHDDVALYLVDLRDPQRSVTKVHPPNWAPKPPEEPKPAAEKKKQ